jgi:Beta-lactamase enzyme family
VPDAHGEPTRSHEAELEEHESPFGVVPEYDTPKDASTPSTTTTVVEPFGTPPPALTFGPTIGGISAVTGNGTLERLCCALADLTDNPANPPYVGVHDEEVLYVGSVQKLSAMYAAFLLRKQVRAQVAAAKAGGLNTSKHAWEVMVVHDLLRDWAPKLRSGFPKLPESLPQFGTMFEFTSTGDVKFPRMCTDEELAEIGFPGDPKGLFGDWLHLMIHWSNDEASSLCIRALGYSYLNGALKDAGFFGGKPEHGLWLAGDYGGHDWLLHPPGHREINPAGKPLAKRWATAQGRTTSNMAATAQQLCKLLTLIARNDLVDATACGDMRTLLDSRDAAGSYLDDALVAAGRRANTQFSKLGIGNDVSYHDCGIVERTITVGSGTKTIRYVVVGLGSKRTDQADLKLLFKTLDDLVVARHP